MRPEIKFLEQNPVSVFLDVGANLGQTGDLVRELGYTGPIVSFEPIAHCYAQLAEKAAKDPLWEARHTAIGTEDGTAQIGVSGNYASSSILEATDELIGIFEPIRYTRYEEVPLARLDTIFDEVVGKDKTAHLKIDTQGFERFVIEGAEGVLDRIRSVRMEVAVREVYKGEMVFHEAIEMMRERGYIMVDAWTAWKNPKTGEVMHFDMLFRRTPG